MKCKCGNSVPPNRTKWCRKKCAQHFWYITQRKTPASRNSATHKGRRMELVGIKLLPGSQDMNTDSRRHSFDILWRGKKIDVKSCEKYRNWWVFNKGKTQADFYFCFCLVNKKPIKILMIPAASFGKGISVGMKSQKFDRFIFHI